MPSRENIVDNVEQYSARELHKYIKQGIITFDELVVETAGYFPADVRKELEALIAGPEPEVSVRAPEVKIQESPMRAVEEPVTVTPKHTAPEPHAHPKPRPKVDDEWESVDKGDLDQLRLFIATHRDHPMCREANRLINELYTGSLTHHDAASLKTEINDIMTNRNVLDKSTKITNTIKEYLEREYITTGEFLSLLREDNNLVSAHVVKSLIDEHFFTYPDLLGIGINQKFLDLLIRGEQKRNFPTPRPVDRINRVSTEIYFWGIPSSGKTCALGGILSMANSGRVVRNMSQDNNCQGYGYMTRLSELFKEDGSVGTLPEGTSIYDVYEMGFDLEDEDGKVHPITCIDLAGELVRCMYKYDAGEPLTEDESMTLQTVTNLLVSNRSTNRKMHFFVLEYGGEERLYEGLGQAAYLRACLEYIKRTRIFDRDTDGVFLLFTKVDKTKLRGQELVNHLVSYTDTYYPNFYNGLVSLCQDYEINGGKVERMPFTLGTVCFQNYCMFEGRSAENVVRQILKRTKGFRKGKFHKLLNSIRK